MAPPSPSARDPALAACREACELQLLNLPFGLYYFGRRLPSGLGAVFVGDDAAITGALPPRLELGPTPDAWDWGADSPGAAHLALALLAERIADPQTALACHQDFLAQVVTRLPAAWCLRGTDIAAWLKKWGGASTPPPAAPVPTVRIDPPPQSTSERRRTSRFLVHLTGQFRPRHCFHEPAVPVIIHNIGADGVGFASPVPLAAGQIFILEIPASRHPPRLLLCRTVYCCPLKANAAIWHLGACIVDYRTHETGPWHIPPAWLHPPV